MSNIEVTDLRIDVGRRRVVDGISFEVAEGDRTCLLGESGSGKSLTAAAVLGCLPEGATATGSIRIDGVEVLGVPPSRRPAQARVSTVFQDSAVALNPLVRVGDQLGDPLRRMRGLSRAQARAAAVELVTSVGLEDGERVVRAFPAELSGGQRQRVCIALALACRTRVMVADEPTTALDVVTQATVLDVLERHTSGADNPALLFITHDFAVAATLCRDALVMREGTIVERGPVERILSAPTHPYAGALVGAARAATIEPCLERTAEVVRLASAGGAESVDDPYFDLRDVSRAYPQPISVLRGRGEPRVALRRTSLRIARGERIGVVGMSGSGKTTLLRMLLGLEPTDTGSIVCDGREIRPGPARRLRWYRRRVQYVPQDPASTLDPRMTVADLVAEPLRRLGVEGDHEAAVREALDAVGLAAGHLDHRAAELSGGQAQRVAIARAIATRPDFLVADEPVSGLDLPMREHVVDLLRTTTRERETGLLLVSHDLSTVAALCERTVVVHRGDVVEDGPTDELLRSPSHPHTRDLLDAIPSLPA